MAAAKRLGQVTFLAEHEDVPAVELARPARPAGPVALERRATVPDRVARWTRVDVPEGRVLGAKVAPAVAFQAKPAQSLVESLAVTCVAVEVEGVRVRRLMAQRRIEFLPVRPMTQLIRFEKKEVRRESNKMSTIIDEGPGFSDPPGEFYPVRRDPLVQFGQIGCESFIREFSQFPLHLHALRPLVGRPRTKGHMHGSERRT